MKIGVRKTVPRVKSLANWILRKSETCKNQDSIQTNMKLFSCIDNVVDSPAQSEHKSDRFRSQINFENLSWSKCCVTMGILPDQTAWSNKCILYWGSIQIKLWWCHLLLILVISYYISLFINQKLLFTVIISNISYMLSHQNLHWKGILISW